MCYASIDTGKAATGWLPQRTAQRFGLLEVIGPLNVEDRGELGLFATFKRQDRIALGHRRFGLPVLIMARESTRSTRAG